MELGISGKKVLITGASRGLGRSIAIALAHEGAQVAIVARDARAVDAVVDEIGGRKNGHCGYDFDLANQRQLELFQTQVISDFSVIDIIVHNLGGTLGIRDPISKMDDYIKVWMFNIGIAIELNHTFLPLMQSQNWGRIVHISSSSAVNVDASLPYSSSKAALNAYVKGLGREVAKNGIIVSAVMPGPFEFEGSHWRNIAERDPERYEKFVTEKMSVQRLGRPEEISGIVTFLCSEQASFFAGAIIPVDGGFK